jgi:hypothetical protein
MKTGCTLYGQKARNIQKTLMLKAGEVGLANARVSFKCKDVEGRTVIDVEIDTMASTRWEQLTDLEQQTQQQ